MNWLWFLLIGLVAGALAKLLMPGDRSEPKGCLLTMLLGVAGSLLVGLLMENVLGFSGRGGTIPTLVGATLGACALIFLMRLFQRDSR